MQRVARGRFVSQTSGHTVSGVQVEITGDREDGVVTMFVRQFVEVSEAKRRGVFSL